IDDLAGPRDDALLRVDHEIADLNNGRDEAATAPKHGAYPRQQLREREGLHQVVVGPDLEAAEPVVEGIGRRDEDDRGIREGLKISSEIDTISDPRQRYVEESEIRTKHADKIIESRTVRGRGNRVPGAFQADTQRESEGLVVLDDEHSWRTRRAS